VDLDAVQKLVDALERDLEQVRDGSADVQRLRDEVQTLQNVLNSPVRRHHWVKEGLHDINGALDREWDSAKAEALTVSRYIAEIGRILGM